MAGGRRTRPSAVTVPCTGSDSLQVRGSTTRDEGNFMGNPVDSDTVALLNGCENLALYARRVDLNSRVKEIRRS